MTDHFDDPVSHDPVDDHMTSYYNVNCVNVHCVHHNVSLWDQKPA